MRLGGRLTVLTFVALASTACPTSNAPCDPFDDQGLVLEDTETHRPLRDGDLLPAWNRPQGGVGTRVDVRLCGFAPDADLDILYMQILEVVDADGPVGQHGGSCRDTEAPCDPLYRCSEGVCHYIIAEQGYRSFPEEQSGEDRIASNLPIAFFFDVTLEDVEVRTGDLEVTLAELGRDSVSAAVRVGFRVGDFVPPEDAQ